MSGCRVAECLNHPERARSCRFQVVHHLAWTATHLPLDDRGAGIACAWNRPLRPAAMPALDVNRSVVICQRPTFASMKVIIGACAVLKGAWVTPGTDASLGQMSCAHLTDFGMLMMEGLLVAG